MSVGSNVAETVLGEFTRTSGLGVNESYMRSERLRLPPALTGRFHLFVQTDALAGVIDTNHEL